MLLLAQSLASVHALVPAKEGPEAPSVPCRQRMDPDASAALSTPCPGSHGQDGDQDLSINSNRCKTQTQRSQTLRVPADIPSRETAEGSLCIQSAHKALFLFPLSAFETICILSKILLSLLLLCFWQPGCGRWRHVQLTAGSSTRRSQNRGPHLVM